MEMIGKIVFVIASCAWRIISTTSMRCGALSFQLPYRFVVNRLLDRALLHRSNNRMPVIPAAACILICFAFPPAGHAQTAEGWIQVQSSFSVAGSTSTPCVAFSQTATVDATTLKNDVTPIANQCIDTVNTLLNAQCAKNGTTGIDVPSLTAAVTFHSLSLGLPTGVTEGFAYGWNPSGGCEGSNSVSANLSVSYGTYQCPAGGSIPIINYAYTYGQYPGVYCGGVFYVEAGQPPLAQISSPDPVGEPVNPNTGSVYLSATDVRAVGSETVGFKRYYNSADAAGTDGVPGWRHSYGRSIATTYQGSRIHNGSSASGPTSPTYLTASAACTSGFAAIQSSVSAWANAIATYSSNVCVLSVNGVNIGTLPVYSLEPLAPPPTPVVIEYDVIRDDGQTIRFAVQNGVISNQPGVSLRIAVTGSGFTVTDDGDNVETYNTAGVLQSIRSRAGVVRTLSYTNGHWSGVTDSFGNSLSVARNTAGAILSVTVLGGGTVKYSYDAQQRLSIVTNLDGSTRNYVYGNPSFLNALTAVVDENGITLSTWNYDDTERVTSAQQAGGANAISLTYNTDGSVSESDAPSGGRTFSYTRVGDINQVTYVNSLCSTCRDSAATTYDPYGWVSSRTDHVGNLTCYAHDPARGVELVRVEGFAPGSTCPGGLASYAPESGTAQRKVETTWSTIWREPSLITEAKRTTGFTFDGAGNILTQTITDLTVSPNVARTWTYTYNSYGQPLTVTGPRGAFEKTTYTYYSCTTGYQYQCGQIETMANSVGSVTFDTHNAYGQLLTLTDANGVLTTLKYDARQRLTWRQIGSDVTQYSYYPTGLLHVVTSPDTSTVTFDYDSAHRLTDIIDGPGNKIHYTLDALGNRTAENSYDPTNAVRRTHSRVFNSLNELAQDINSGGAATYIDYDGGGNITLTAGPSGVTRQVFDALNRVNQITDPTNGITKLTYDANDNLISVTDPRTLTTSYSYNGFGKVTKRISPDRGTANNTYDLDGNLATSTDARGAEATYSYDALSRKIKVVYSDQTISYSYDSGTNGKGHLTGASDANHTLAWTYDSQGRINGKSQTVASVTKSVGYAYTNGDLITLKTPSGQTITYGYSNHRITSIKVGSTTLLSGVTYDPFGPATGWTWGNNATSTRSFDQDGNPSSIVTAGTTNAYTLNAASRISQITDSTLSTNTWNFTSYDNLDRILAASSSAKSRGYTYDANGNRTAQTGTSPYTATISTTNNHLNSTSGGLVRTYAYDAAGNTKSYTGETFTFNQRGRMSSATSSAGATNYVYNALGQMIEKSGIGGTTLLMYDERGHILGEYSSTGALIQETLWMDDLPVATLRPSGSTVAIYYVHANHLGAPVKVTRPSDNGLMWRYDPDTFGSSTSTPNSNPAGLGTFTYNLRFSGQYALTESGLNYNYFRTYDPQTGQYLESDPIGLRGGVNTYAYVGGNPVTRTDPSGLFASPWHFGITFVAALNAGYSLGGSLTIAWFSVTTDIGTQGIDDANIHSMAIGGPNPQSVADAQAGAQAYVDSQLAQGTLGGIGNAVHTEEDEFASGHEFQTWNGGLPSLDHEIGDWFPSSQSVTDAYLAAFSTLQQMRNPPPSCPQ
jgi:RHS repeat-associated protein